MKKCPRCGYDVYTNDNFCGFCGYNLSECITDRTFTKQELKLNDIRLNLGKVYIKQGKNDLAIELFEKVLEQDPKNLKIKKMLGKAKEEMLGKAKEKMLGKAKEEILGKAKEEILGKAKAAQL